MGGMVCGLRGRDVRDIGVGDIRVRRIWKRDRHGLVCRSGSGAPGDAGVGGVYMSGCKDFSLTNGEKGSNMDGTGRWIACPACGNGKLLRVYPTTMGVDVPVYCKRCRRHVRVNIDLQ